MASRAAITAIKIRMNMFSPEPRGELPRLLSATLMEENVYNSKFLLSQLAAIVLLSSAAYGQSPMIVSPDGKYLGNLNNNPYDPDSVANPYGRYGSRFSPDSVNNPYGQYGSRVSPDSARSPYGQGAIRRPGFGN